MNDRHETSETPDTTSPQNARYCVFRNGLAWLALPALVVREVLPRPNMVFVPGTPKSFIGLCHVRSEFIPVLNLKGVLAEDCPSNEQILLILDDADGAWGFLIDEAASLQDLEISDAPEADGFDAECVVIGWATFGDAVIRVLDQARIRQRAEQELAEMWQSINPLMRHLAMDSARSSSNLS